jgi:hypothetical protein
MKFYFVELKFSILKLNKVQYKKLSKSDLFCYSLTIKINKNFPKTILRDLSK